MSSKEKSTYCSSEPGIITVHAKSFWGDITQLFFFSSPIPGQQNFSPKLNITFVLSTMQARCLCLSPGQEYSQHHRCTKVPEYTMLGVTLQWTSIPSREELSLHATETGRNSSLMGHLACIDINSSC